MTENPGLQETLPGRQVLITGGAGFIGSTVASACLDSGLDPVILDDLSTGSEEFTAGRHFYRGDIADGTLIDRIFDDHPDIFAVVHCAAKIDVPESVDHPLEYFHNNVSKSIDLIAHVRRNGVSRFLFSSSAAVYGAGENLTVDEFSQVSPASPYAMSKLMVEKILDSVASTTDLRAVSFRYFNPVGIDPRMRTGPADSRPTHAVGKLVRSFHSSEPFTITGVEWPTRDGSAIRDYVHVWDLAAAHVLALEQFDCLLEAGHLVINLGSGRGTTVRELVAAFGFVTGTPLQAAESEPRPGDVVGSYCRCDRARELLGWSAKLTVDDAIRHALQWHSLRSATELQIAAEAEPLDYVVRTAI